MRPALSAFLLLLLAPSPVKAAAVRCNAAQTTREKTVCASKDLSTLDDQLTEAYEATRAQLTPPSAALVQADQRDWLAWIDKICPANDPGIDNLTDCFTEHYQTRLDQLTKGVQRLDGLLFFTRAHFVFVPGKAPDRTDNDPGFGYGEFAWPQIDAPDADHALWNTAVHDAAVNVESGTPAGKAGSLDKSVDANGNSFGYFSISAVNLHFIDVDLFLSTYGWGAAHPLTGESSFLWSLDQRHALTAADILRPDTAWQTALLDPTLAKLQQKLGADNIWKGKELHDALATTLKDPHSWDLSSAGLTITFGQYAVTSYAQGMPEITLTWQELAPFLNPAFNPTLLPPPLHPE